MSIKRWTALLLALSLILAVFSSAAENYRALEAGSAGDDVLTLKQRLYDLGYYTTAKLNGNYNDSAVSVIRQFQYANGLLTTGTADAYTQAVLYSGAALRVDGQRDVPGTDLPQEGSGGDGQYRDLAEGAYGDDVLAVKTAFYRLKYYNSTDFNNVFNAAMTQRVQRWQQENGYAADGVMTAQQQLFLLGTRSAASGGVAGENPVELPERNEAGFLADLEAEPFVYASYDTGYWYYIDQQLYIEIVRYTNPNNHDLNWYETEVICAPGVTWNALMSQGSREEGHNFEDGMTIADRGQAILAVTDDNYGYRWYRRNHDKNYKYLDGVVIRNGIVRADAMPDDSYYDFPPLDVLAYYPDGHIELYYPEEHDAQDYLDMGVLHTYCFGPILLKDGQVNQRLYDPGSKTLAAEYVEEAARQAIGYYGPGHYLILTANGNHDSRTGVVMQWMVDKMIEKGVTDAFNLDGGRTTLLYFMGQAVNKKENVNRGAMREITGMLGIGTR